MMKIEIPFWRDEPLSEREKVLLDAVLLCHEKSTQRQNVSSAVFQNSAMSSGRFVNGLIAALATLGGPHAPLEKTIEFLLCDQLDFVTQHIVNEGAKIPGWGNSFEKGHKDETWISVDEILQRDWPEYYERIQIVTNILRVSKKNIYPNPSCYTAITCIILGVPKNLSPYIFIVGRLDGWMKLLNPNQYGK